MANKLIQLKDGNDNVFPKNAVQPVVIVPAEGITISLNISKHIDDLTLISFSFETRQPLANGTSIGVIQNYAPPSVIVVSALTTGENNRNAFQINISSSGQITVYGLGSYTGSCTINCCF